MTISEDLSDFIAFLLAAKRSSYAAGGGSPVSNPLLQGSKQLEYRSGSLFYRDIYFGGIFFAGQETVYDQDVPVWSMVYAGGPLAEAGPLFEPGPVYGFLQQAMRLVGPVRPFRGPANLVSGDLVYNDEGGGDINSFHGVESITRAGVRVYELYYSGGWLR